MVTKHLDSNTKRLEVLLCYDFANEVTNEEEDVLLALESNLFAIDTITLPKLKVLAMMFDAKTSTDAKSILMQKLILMQNLILMWKSIWIPKLVLI